jgi:hypothetical protein
MPEQFGKSSDAPLDHLPARRRLAAFGLRPQILLIVRLNLMAKLICRIGCKAPSHSKDCQFELHLKHQDMSFIWTPLPDC